MSAIVNIDILFTAGLTILKFYILIYLVSDIYFKMILCSVYFLNLLGGGLIDDVI